MTGSALDGSAFGGGRTPASGPLGGDCEAFGRIVPEGSLIGSNPRVPARGGIAWWLCDRPSPRSTADSRRSSPRTELTRDSGRSTARAADRLMPSGALSADRRSEGAARSPHNRKHASPMTITRPAGPTRRSGRSGWGRPAIEGFPSPTLGADTGVGASAPGQGTAVSVRRRTCRSRRWVVSRSGSVRMAMVRT
jgi:hypothetical protein